MDEGVVVEVLCTIRVSMDKTMADKSVVNTNKTMIRL